ncbi:unnamed protein product, partial [Closterium sp. Naga37s-1]
LATCGACPAGATKTSALPKCAPQKHSTPPPPLPPPLVLLLPAFPTGPATRHPIVSSTSFSLFTLPAFLIVHLKSHHPVLPPPCPLTPYTTHTPCINHPSSPYPPPFAGATPTVSSTSFTFYDQPNFTITRFTSTMRINWDGCTDITLPRATDVLSYTRIEPAPGGGYPPQGYPPPAGYPPQGYPPAGYPSGSAYSAPRGYPAGNVAHVYVGRPNHKFKGRKFKGFIGKRKGVFLGKRKGFIGKRKGFIGKRKGLFGRRKGFFK